MRTPMKGVHRLVWLSQQGAILSGKNQPCFKIQLICHKGTILTSRLNKQLSHGHESFKKAALLRISKFRKGRAMSNSLRQFVVVLVKESSPKCYSKMEALNRVSINLKKISTRNSHAQLLISKKFSNLQGPTKCIFLHQNIFFNNSAT